MLQLANREGIEYRHSLEKSTELKLKNSQEPAAIPAPTFLRLSAGFIYFYFGFLKLYPDLSPAELLASQTIMRLSYHWLDAQTALWLLAIMECVIGLSFLFNVGMRWLFFVFLSHQAATFLPLFMFDLLFLDNRKKSPD